MEIFKVENLSFSFPEQSKEVLRDVSFSVRQGEFVVIFGESGSGKTTLLKLLKQELTPHGKRKGNVFYNGMKLETLERRSSSSEIGYVMQNPDEQIVMGKVWHELAFGLENLGVATPIIRRRIGEMAHFFGIHHWFHQKTTDLSGGQKQILNLASVMVMQPKVLLLDEPTSQLDPIAASEFMSMLQKLNRDLGLTIMMVEHRLEEALPLAEQVFLLESGSLIMKEQPSFIGQRLKQLSVQHKMLEALPSAVRIFNGLDGRGESPLTVREGMRFLSSHYDNQINHLAETMKMEKEDTILELKNIWFRYERDLPDVLAGVNLKVKKGEIVSILGGNGSGKTTLLSVLAGLHRPYRGTFLINGQNVKKYKGKELYRHNIALLPQDPKSLFLETTVRADYKQINKIMKFSKTEFESNMNRVVDMLSIEELLDVHPANLSGGEQQKAALGKILLLQPEILLLDEPTKGLDVFSEKILHDILTNLKKQGVAIIIVTHDIEFSAMVSDRCGLFFDKEITSMDTPVSFFSNNSFYTTMANRISRHMYRNAITCDDVIKLCRLNESLIKEHV